MFMKYLFGCAFLSVVLAQDKHGGRKAKFLTFNTQGEDISVQLEFSVPFLTIPVKKTVDRAFDFADLSLPTINVNIASLALAAIAVFGTAVLAPLLLKTFASHNPHYRYSKLIDESHFGADTLLDYATKVLDDSGSFHGCALRIACWSAQKNTGLDSMMLLHTAMENKVLSTMINSTAIEDALITGRKGRDCTTYTPCPLRENHASMILSNIAEISNRAN